MGKIRYLWAIGSVQGENLRVCGKKHTELGRYRRRKMNAVSGAGAEELKLGTVHAVLAELAMFKASCCMRESHINKGSRRNDPPMVEATHWV